MKLTMIILLLSISLVYNRLAAVDKKVLTASKNAVKRTKQTPYVPPPAPPVLPATYYHTLSSAACSPTFLPPAFVKFNCSEVGKPVEAQINLNRYVGNIGGQLVYVSDGHFSNSCNDCSTSPAGLRCKCLNDQNTYVETFLLFDEGLYLHNGLVIFQWYRPYPNGCNSTTPSTTIEPCLPRSNSIRDPSHPCGYESQPQCVESFNLLPQSTEPTPSTPTTTLQETPYVPPPAPPVLPATNYHSLMSAACSPTFLPPAFVKFNCSEVGKPVEAQINLNRYVGNIGGQLVYVSDGNFSHSCNDCSTSIAGLRCKCLDNQNAYVETFLFFNEGLYLHNGLVIFQWYPPYPNGCNSTTPSTTIAPCLPRSNSIRDPSHPCGYESQPQCAESFNLLTPRIAASRKSKTLRDTPVVLLGPISAPPTNYKTLVSANCMPTLTPPAFVKFNCSEDGKAVEAQINLNRYVANKNGQLVYNSEGMYSITCKDCVASPAGMTCKCLNEQNVYTDAWLPFLEGLYLHNGVIIFQWYPPYPNGCAAGSATPCLPRSSSIRDIAPQQCGYDTQLPCPDSINIPIQSTTTATPPFVVQPETPNTPYTPPNLPKTDYKLLTEFQCTFTMRPPTWLMLNCQNNGKRIRAEILLDRYIGNQNGQLFWVADGNYSAQCKNCVTTNFGLDCSCPNTNYEYVLTSLPFDSGLYIDPATNHVIFQRYPPTPQGCGPDFPESPMKICPLRSFKARDPSFECGYGPQPPCRDSVLVAVEDISRRKNNLKRRVNSANVPVRQRYSNGYYYRYRN